MCRSIPTKWWSRWIAAPRCRPWRSISKCRMWGCGSPRPKSTPRPGVAISATLDDLGHGGIAIKLNGRPEQKIDHVLEGPGATAPGDPRLRINLNLLMRARSARHDGTSVRNLLDAVERLCVGVKPAEQIVDCVQEISHARTILAR